ncbi:universal stress protein [bacterium]|nr:universal stress protein [bacterium]MBU1984367.1 universal stress protein [bacterium]
MEALRCSLALSKAMQSRLTVLEVVAPSRQPMESNAPVWGLVGGVPHLRSSSPDPRRPQDAQVPTEQTPVGVPAMLDGCAFLGRVLGECDLEGVEFEARITVGTPATEVLLAARKHGCGLIVAGSSPRAGLIACLGRGVAETVVEISDRPVLILPSPQQTSASPA